MTNSASPEVTNPYAVEDEIAAGVLGISPASLQKDRAVGHLGIPFVRAGRRILYRLCDLESWLEQNCTTPISDVQGGARNV